MPDLHNRSVDILLVEDNPDDVDLTIEAFKESGSQSRLYVVEDGVEALAFLRPHGGGGMLDSAGGADEASACAVAPAAPS